jgi:hypothetical protein
MKNAILFIVSIFARQEQMSLKPKAFSDLDGNSKQDIAVENIGENTIPKYINSTPCYVFFTPIQL